MSVLIIHPYPIIQQAIARLVHKAFPDTECVFAKDAVSIPNEGLSAKAVIFEPFIEHKPQDDGLAAFLKVDELAHLEPIVYSDGLILKKLKKLGIVAHFCDSKKPGAALHCLIRDRLIKAGFTPAKKTEYLTRREIQILNLFDNGSTCDEVAARLGLSSSTIKVHSHRAFHRLGVNSRTKALRVAKDKGLI